ncbi:MAG: branched-chain amino acid aminotransferase [Lachnospiraceae bacterium]|nr:branched-chain amino acid aminotransferase [Lachnospiraceae bacterium]
MIKNKRSHGNSRDGDCVARKEVEKMSKDIDWSNLGFGYIKTDKRFVANFKDDAWDAGVLTEDANVVISECAGVLQYAQTCFEGLKAYTTEDGRVVCFRPDLNASRMADSCRRLRMPVFPEEKFVEAVVETVKANIDYVPPYGSGATLYIRPYMFGSNPVIGVKPADEYQFRIFCTPVGPYFKGGAKPIVIRVCDYDRAAPHGTGHIKAGLNYAMSLYQIVEAHEEGFAENMYLDSATRTKVEETGGANFIFITKDGTLVTPKSDSILPSITRRSLMYVAENYLGMKVEHREVYLDEVKDFAEAGLCGTAAVISPVGKINDHGKEICLPSGMDEMGPVTKKLYDTLTGIQMGRIEAPEGWIKEIK